MWFVGAAWAYDRNDADWASQPAPVEEPFSLNAASFGDVAAPDDVEAVFLRAIDTWNAESGADLYVEYGGRTSEVTQGGGDDGVNVAAYGDTTWGTALAVSTWGYIDVTVNDCDTMFYASNFDGAIAWHAGDGPAPAGAFDLQHTMTHELGHCLGLGHGEAQSIMRATNGDGTGDEARHLTDDDRAGIQAIYGAVYAELVAEPVSLGAVGEGEELTIRVPVRNTGDGTAWDVSALVDGTVAVAMGTIAADTPVGRRVGAASAELSFPWTPCDDRREAIPVEWTDRLGETWFADVEVSYTCEPIAGGPGTGSGCATAHPADGIGAALAVLIFVRRRRA